MTRGKSLDHRDPAMTDHSRRGDDPVGAAAGAAARTRRRGREMQAKQRSAVVFGARNLGRAVIEMLVSDGWAVTGVARSQSTLEGVSASGALALNADVTNPASVYGVLEQAAAAHGGVELVLNAAAAYSV
jgi:short chain dehydrogenase